MDEIRPVQPGDIELVAHRLRDADRDEVWASNHLKPLEALRSSVSRSLESWTWTVDGVPEAVGGVGALDMLAGIGVPWMLGTDAVQRNARAFLRMSRPTLDMMHGYFPHLRNMVDARNTISIRWLKWLGFTLDKEATPHGPDGLPFYIFWRDK